MNSVLPDREAARELLTALLVQDQRRSLPEISIPAPGKAKPWKALPGSTLLRPFRELGVPMEAVTENVGRPIFVEVPLGVFAGVHE